LFSAPKPTFGAPTSSAGFGFPQTTTTSTASSSLFGAKPTTGFGATPTQTFGAAPAATTPFGGFGNLQTIVIIKLFLKIRLNYVQIKFPAFVGTSGTGLFGNSQTSFGAKPAAPLTFGTATSTAPTLGFGTPSSQTLFGGTTATSTAKPLFGTNTAFGNTGFGTTSGFGTTTGGLTGGIGGGTTSSLFGSSQPSASASPFGTAQQASGSSSGSQLPIHQYILTLSEISQSSDHPLFRKMLEPSGVLLKKITN